MAIRESINKHPKVAISVMSVACLGTLWFAICQMRPSPPGTTEFYSDDDGKTWFSDTAGRVVPYEKDGKEVVLAQVFKSDTKPAFVAYLQRYTAASLKKISGNTPSAQPGELLPPGLADNPAVRMEYKKPGDTKWHDIEGNIKAMSQYLVLNSGDGSQLMQVEP